MLLLQRDLQKAVRFYGEGIGLPVRVVTERWAELSAGPSTLALKAAYGCVEGGGGGGELKARNAVAGISWQVPTRQLSRIRTSSA